MDDSDALLERIDGLDMRKRGVNGAMSLGPPRYVHLDPATFSDDRPQKFTHSLRGHPLMTLPPRYC